MNVGLCYHFEGVEFFHFHLQPTIIKKKKKYIISQVGRFFSNKNGGTRSDTCRPNKHQYTLQSNF